MFSELFEYICKYTYVYDIMYINMNWPDIYIFY